MTAASTPPPARQQRPGLFPPGAMPEEVLQLPDEDILTAAGITMLPGETPQAAARRVLRAAGLADNLPLATDILGDLDGTEGAEHQRKTSRSRRTRRSPA